MIRILCLDVSNIDPSTYKKLYSRATEARKRRADRYRQTENVLCCIGAGALLSFAVKQHLGLETFTLAEKPLGKPFIPEVPDFHFNLSHSGSWVVLAFGDSPVGIDVEKLEYTPGRQQVMRRFFTPEEQAYVQEDPAEEGERFFRIWTAKESWLKYTGEGLTRPISSFSVLSMDRVKFFTRAPAAGYLLTLYTEEVPGELEYPTVESLL